MHGDHHVGSCIETLLLCLLSSSAHLPAEHAFNDLQEPVQQYDDSSVVSYICQQAPAGRCVIHHTHKSLTALLITLGRCASACQQSSSLRVAFGAAAMQGNIQRSVRPLQALVKCLDGFQMAN